MCMRFIQPVLNNLLNRRDSLEEFGFVFFPAENHPLSIHFTTLMMARNEITYPTYFDRKVQKMRFLYRAPSHLDRIIDAYVKYN